MLNYKCLNLLELNTINKCKYVIKNISLNDKDRSLSSKYIYKRLFLYKRDDGNDISGNKK